MNNPAMGTSVKKQAINASIWTLGGFGSSQVIRLGSHLVLAWLLTPEVFGIMALVKVFMHGLEMFSDIGIKPSIIQSKRGYDANFLNTAWTMQAIRGCALWIASCLLAWPYATFFAGNDPSAAQLVYLIPVAALTAVLHGFQSTALATLDKDLKLGRVTSLEISSQLVSLSVMICWAWIAPSVWAMIAGGLTAAVYKLVRSHQMVPGHRVRFQWDRDCVGELIRFGKWIFLSTIFTFLALNMDRVILGRVLTLSELGLYSIAFVFCRVPLHVSARLGGSVLFPVYAKYKHDLRRMMDIALRARRVVLAVGLATCLAMAVGARLFFETLWDERYIGIAPIAHWLVFYVWTMILLLSMDCIPLAMGNSRVLFTSNVVRSLGVLIGAAGYWIAELPGFILGMACGPLLAQYQILPHLPSKRWQISLQGARFTGLGLIYGIGAVLFTESLYAQMAYLNWALVVVTLALLPVAIAVGFAWPKLRGGEHSAVESKLIRAEQVSA